MISTTFNCSNDYSVKKRLTIGIGSFVTLSALGFYAGKKIADRRRNERILPSNNKEEEALLPPKITVSSERVEEANQNDDSYLPWWRDVKEIAIYINDENKEIIEKEVPSLHKVVYSFVIVLLNI